jgi:hypothetical protein
MNNWYMQIIRGKNAIEELNFEVFFYVGEFLQYIFKIIVKTHSPVNVRK